ncbi:MAG: bifunctional aldolase/short-chain dehydrogenase [Methylococcales bacterium]|nr:bifunctional aldolase/short-chain dehydrogenase [Methylococcales bacterium]MBT7444732.1 bifunctional aldolase/short-chain dehydrogenase [Methylococcales bacterium]
MKNLWQDEQAAKYTDELGLRVYTSRLLGQDASLVLHGGGNTSVKITEINLVGEEEEILYVKGSGWDLETIEAAGFAPVRMAHLLKLAKLPSLTDAQMVNELKTQMTNSSAPSPSVETILHATLPYKYVDHTHADAVVTVTNNSAGLERIKAIYGDEVVIIPYIMPGFDLAKRCAEIFEADATDKTIGMVLMNHGMFSFADTAKESYGRMIYLVEKAEEYLKKENAWALPEEAVTTTSFYSLEQAELRHWVSQAAGAPVILATDSSERCLRFVKRNDIKHISQQGPATPDHVIRTKQLPMICHELSEYIKNYQSYFEAHASTPRDGQEKTMLNPTPKVILNKQQGLVAVGQSVKEAQIVADIYHHTMDIIERATLLGGYQALPDQDIFDMEYWELEQAKLKKSGFTPEFAGEVVVISGAASGIGKACVETFLGKGAAVIALDYDPSVTSLFESEAYLGLNVDVTDSDGLQRSLDEGVKAFGGIDMLILNAGVFPGGCRIDALKTNEWRRVLGTNLDATFVLMKLVHPYLKLAPNGGRAVVIGSKNVPAPGPGAAAYSASKAGVNQLARVAALEWGADNIRVNTVHPNAVFDTGLWTESVLADRAAHYGLTVEEYKSNNVLKTEVTSSDVAELTAAMCGDLFAKTTGGQVPIDGGNYRVI